MSDFFDENDLDSIIGSDGKNDEDDLLEDEELDEDEEYDEDGEYERNAPASRPVRERPRGLGAAISSFIFALLAIIHSVVFMTLQFAVIEYKQDTDAAVAARSRASTMYDYTVEYDYSGYEVMAKVMMALTVVLVAIAVLCSIVAFAKGRNNQRKGKTVVFAVVGLVLAIVGVGLMLLTTVIDAQVVA